MPKISVIVPTNRVGGLDVLTDGLIHQSFKDFELILVDCLHEKRAHLQWQLSVMPFPIQHVKPRENLFPTTCYQRCMNAGLIAAKGEIVFVTSDYAFLTEDCLKKHAKFHDEHRSNTALVGPFAQLGEPSPHPGFPSNAFGPEWNYKWNSDDERRVGMNAFARAYVNVLESQLLRQFMWSIFNTDFDHATDMPDLAVLNVSNYVKYPSGPSIPGICNLKNDSFRLEDLVNANGFDEDFDGAHFCQDYEIAERLARTGTQFHLDRDAIVFIIDVHHHMMIRHSERGDKSNFEMFKRKHESQINTVNPHFSLRQLRQEAGRT